VLVFPVGDAASQTLLVRVAVANPEKIAPGEKVFINFTAGAGVAAKP
jgi:hypothetical protein